MDRGSVSKRVEPARRPMVEAIAVGSLAFVKKIKGELGSKAMHREVEQFEGTHVLREESEVYGFKSAGEKESLSPENTVFWNESFEDART